MSQTRRALEEFAAATNYLSEQSDALSQASQEFQANPDNPEAHERFTKMSAPEGYPDVHKAAVDFQEALNSTSKAGHSRGWSGGEEELEALQVAAQTHGVDPGLFVTPDGASSKREHILQLTRVYNGKFLPGDGRSQIWEPQAHSFATAEDAQSFSDMVRHYYPEVQPQVEEGQIQGQVVGDDGQPIPTPEPTWSVKFDHEDLGAPYPPGTAAHANQVAMQRSSQMPHTHYVVVDSQSGEYQVTLQPEPNEEIVQSYQGGQPLQPPSPPETEEPPPPAGEQPPEETPVEEPAPTGAETVAAPAQSAQGAAPGGPMPTGEDTNMIDRLLSEWSFVKPKVIDEWRRSRKDQRGGPVNPPRSPGSLEDLSPAQHAQLLQHMRRHKTWNHPAVKKILGIHPEDKVPRFLKKHRTHQQFHKALKKINGPSMTTAAHFEDEEALEEMKHLFKASLKRTPTLMMEKVAVDSNRGVTARGNSHFDRFASPETREKVLEARMKEIEAFAQSRKIPTSNIFAATEAAMRTGKVPDLGQYGLAGDDAVATKQFIISNILNIQGLEARDYKGDPIEESEESSEARKKRESKEQVKEILWGRRKRSGPQSFNKGESFRDEPWPRRGGEGGSPVRPQPGGPWKPKPSRPSLSAAKKFENVNEARRSPDEEESPEAITPRRFLKIKSQGGRSVRPYRLPKRIKEAEEGSEERRQAAQKALADQVGKLMSRRPEHPEVQAVVRRHFNKLLNISGHEPAGGREYRKSQGLISADIEFSDEDVERAIIETHGAYGKAMVGMGPYTSETLRTKKKDKNQRYPMAEASTKAGGYPFTEKEKHYRRHTDAQLAYAHKDALEAARAMREHDPVAHGWYMDDASTIRSEMERRQKRSGRQQMSDVDFDGTNYVSEEGGPYRTGGAPERTPLSPSRSLPGSMAPVDARNFMKQPFLPKEICNKLRKDLGNRVDGMPRWQLLDIARERGLLGTEEDVQYESVRRDVGPRKQPGIGGPPHRSGEPVGSMAYWPETPDEERPDWLPARSSRPAGRAMRPGGEEKGTYDPTKSRSIGFGREPTKAPYTTKTRWPMEPGPVERARKEAKKEIEAGRAELSDDPRAKAASAQAAAQRAASGTGRSGRRKPSWAEERPQRDIERHRVGPIPRPPRQKKAQHVDRIVDFARRVGEYEGRPLILRRDKEALKRMRGDMASLFSDMAPDEQRKVLKKLGNHPLSKHLAGIMSDVSEKTRSARKQGRSPRSADARRLAGMRRLAGLSDDVDEQANLVEHDFEGFAKKFGGKFVTYVQPHQALYEFPSEEKATKFASMYSSYTTASPSVKGKRVSINEPRLGESAQVAPAVSGMDPRVHTSGPSTSPPSKKDKKKSKTEDTRSETDKILGIEDGDPRGESWPKISSEMQRLLNLEDCRLFGARRGFGHVADPEPVEEATLGAGNVGAFLGGGMMPGGGMVSRDSMIAPYDASYDLRKDQEDEIKKKADEEAEKRKKRLADLLRDVGVLKKDDK